MTTLFENPTSDAIFSEDRHHRYLLKRIWDEKRPFAMVIGLNPSTASEDRSDPTITRLTGPKGLLGNNGYGGLFMVNLFTMVTPYPEQLIKDTTQHAQASARSWWETTALQCQRIIFAWGNFKNLHGRDSLAKALFPDALCFGHNTNGSPKHPLYLKGTTKLVRYQKL